MDNINTYDAPEVSIIIPVYNAEKFIRQCIDSVLNQNFRNFELLLVDDGSPDNSPAICEEYAKADERVKAIHKPNGGAASARNTGIECACGKFVVFIDSDDWIDSNYISNMYDAYTRCSCESENLLVMSDFQTFTEGKTERRTLPDEIKVDFKNCTASAEDFRNLVFEKIVFTPCCKLYIKAIIEKNNIRFDTELKSAEDFDFNNRYIEKTDFLYYIPSAEYHYRIDYKKYRPSNHGVLGDSEIKSVHIMANGIVNFAKRLGVYDEVYDEICIWAAKKHYFNRMPMLFAENAEVSAAERRKLYKRLISDEVYRSLHKRGITFMDKSTTQLIGSKFDSFDSWLLFYKAVQLRNK